MPPQPSELDPPAEISGPAVWIDVREPAKVKRALQENAWLAGQLRGPLGRGFLGSWGPFLGTQGEDLSARFKGAVGDLALGALFAKPFRIAWWTSRDETFAPALIVPRPGDPVRLAFSALDEAARKGDVRSRCSRHPGSEDVRIARWLLAEHAVYVAQREDRIVLARHPAAVVQAVCGSLPSMGGSGDLSISFVPERLGRGAQLASAVVGLAGPVALQLDADGDRLVADGLAAGIERPERLGKGSASADLLKLLPASTPVVLLAHLQLPESLDAASLGAFWTGASMKTVRRDATIAWWPRGDPRAGFELAVLWSRPQDDAALAAMFTGKNSLVAATLCNHVALASSPAVLERLRRACAGDGPSFQDLGDPVLRGLERDSSLQLTVQLGRALPALLRDGYWSEQDQRGTAPKEIESAARDLSLLPTLGFSGTAEAKRLVPGGSGS